VCVCVYVYMYLYMYVYIYIYMYSWMSHQEPKMVDKIHHGRQRREEAIIVGQTKREGEGD
jgi:hypothetical protein